MKTAKIAIIESFLHLLTDIDFEDISVKQIVQHAKISRSTFYLHFPDKYELMNEVRKTLNDQFLLFYNQEPYNRKKSVTPFNICEHVFKYRSFYEVEFDNAHAVRDLSNQLAVKLFHVYEDQDYAIFASYGTIGYLSFWVRSGFTISPGEAAEKLLKIGFTDWTSDLKVKLDLKIFEQKF